MGKWSDYAASDAGKAEYEMWDKKNRPITIEVYQHDFMPGFAAFMDDGSIQSDAKAHVSINVGSLLAACDMGDICKDELPYLIAESLMHEFVHVCESWAGVEFSEEKVEALIDKYREKYGKKSSKDYLDDPETWKGIGDEEESNA